jgi:isopentenyl diphosphate isomerase/L-lactate dehydrogenase-like FMN-dependent dehydrogenase
LLPQELRKRDTHYIQYAQKHKLTLRSNTYRDHYQCRLVQQVLILILLLLLLLLLGVTALGGP